MKEKRKNELSKWEIELISMLAMGFVFETVNELMRILDLEEVEKKTDYDKKSR